MNIDLLTTVCPCVCLIVHKSGWLCVRTYIFLVPSIRRRSKFRAPVYIVSVIISLRLDLLPLERDRGRAGGREPYTELKTYNGCLSLSEPVRLSVRPSVSLSGLAGVRLSPKNTVFVGELMQN